MKLRSATIAPICPAGEMLCGEVARVQAFEQRDARIRGERRIELPVADIDRDDMRGAALQQHLREAAGRGAEVERRQAGRIEAEGIEAGDQLQRRARDVTRRRDR